MRSVYEKRLVDFRDARSTERVLSLRLGWARVAVFGVAFALYVVWDVTSGVMRGGAGIGALSAAGLFLVLVVWHRRVRARERRLDQLLEINRVAIARVDRDWKALPEVALPDPGTDHSYARDLDVCGEASLFRLLTTLTLPAGQSTLRGWLLNPADPEELRRRQEAVEELAPKVGFRQTLEATGRLTESPDPAAMASFLEWAEEDPWLGAHGRLLLGAWVFPLLTLLLAWLHFSGTVAGPWWLFSLAGSFTVASLHRGRIHALMEAASGGQERFNRYGALLTQLLEMKAKAPILLELQATVRSSPVGAVRELRRLGRRVSWADIRLSGMAHAPLQALFAWDVHVLGFLERWKKRSGPHVRDWLEALGCLEALAALAALKSDHPDWCYPTFREEGSLGLEATELGHPLLAADVCVPNDLVLGPPGSFLFVTGSNMSGKSTLLRAVGLNTVLAQAGGPVCAKRMELTPLAVHTSMRTADSLVEGVSQYMAELKRIQQVVRGAWEGEAVLYLLDEPLQGTNEAERRVAVQTILGHLLYAGAIGGVATHDLYLDNAPKLKNAARAVHLEGQVREGDEGPLITFDYKLRPGRATSTNALALLRAVGLGEEGRATWPGPPPPLPE